MSGWPTPQEHLDTLAALTDEQRQAFRWAVKEWVRVAQHEGYEPLAAWTNHLPEVDHSALLFRLLAGKSPFVDRPERVYSYRDYDSMEDADAPLLYPSTEEKQ